MSEDISNGRNAAAIEVRSISKSFSARAVLKDVSFETMQAEAVCLCGINGAGKSTLLRIIAGLLCPDGGSVWISGHDVRTEPEEVKRRLGVISHRSMVYENLTVTENLSFFANLYGVEEVSSRIEGLMRETGLLSYRHDTASILSRGLLQRLAIARSLVHRPKVLLADEPFTGLDSEACGHLISVFEDFRSSGGTIVMTTHDTSIALRCCNRVIVLDARRVILDAATSEIDSKAFVKDYLSYSRNAN